MNDSSCCRRWGDLKHFLPFFIKVVQIGKRPPTCCNFPVAVAKDSVCVLRTKWGKNYKWSVSVSFYWQEVGSFCLILLLNVFVGLVIFLAFTSSGYGKVVFVFRGNSLPCLLFGFSFTIIHDSQDISERGRLFL